MTGKTTDKKNDDAKATGKEDKPDDDRAEIIAANKELFEANKELNREAEVRKMEMEEIKAMISQYIPTSTPARHDAAGEDIDPGGEALFEGDKLIQPVYGEITEPLIKQKLEMEEFMTNMVEVSIQPSAELESDKTFPISVNGQTEIFTTGQTKVVKRRFVEGLARAKKTGYASIPYTDSKGVKGFKYPPTTGLRFNFSVISDPHPRGHDWLNHVLRQQ